MYRKVNPSDPASIPKFVDELPKPAIAKPKYCSGQPRREYYELQMMAAEHRFHKRFPLSTIWGYNGLYPGPTIEASKDKTIYVKYKNQLPNKHFLPVDVTLHAANDSQEVRTVTHLHGANVDWESDGHSEAWYTKDFIHTGPKFTKEIHEYTNHQPGTTMWYHDHAMALTRLNVYAGLAGFYLLRDTLEERSNLPCGDYEFPLLIQDKTFNQDGSLFYPDAPTFPVPVDPSITPGFVGNTIVVNGKVWPYLNVEPRKYRFRLLNGANRRGFVISLSNEQSMIQLGTDGGFLTAPREIQFVELLPAERTDVVIDFTDCAGQEITLLNTDTDFIDEHTSMIMKFNVNLPLQCEDTSDIPERLAVSMDLHPHHAHIERNLPLSASTDDFGRPMLLLNNRMYHDPATEKPARDTIEVWNFINTTPFIHPIHIHLIQFKILERRPFDVELYQSEGKLEFTGPPEEPLDYEQGWKDTVKADAGKVTKIIMHWKDHIGHYMWHCHFLEHEDHDMMRPILVMKDVHPVQQPHAETQHTSEQHQSTTTVTNTPQQATPLLNNTHNIASSTKQTQHSAEVHSAMQDDDVLHEDDVQDTDAKEDDQVRPLIQPMFPSNRPRPRPRPNRRRRRRR
ncbi:spore coat protein A [Lysinibacillus parviboronicapiens]|uniref:Spore coat protein A n=1 Tax=Lysinibacillus parviboronicapiens TaxID=436516 RepID=A0ABV2PGH6_9BACI